LESIEEALSESDDPDYVFPKRGGGEPDPANLSWKKPAGALLKKSGVPHFTCDDFRATVITGLSSEPLSFPEITVAKVANHANQAITDRYIRHGYDAEKRRALEAWSDRISEIAVLAPMPSNVEQLRVR
jgi:integrase